MPRKEKKRSHLKAGDSLRIRGSETAKVFGKIFAPQGSTLRVEHLRSHLRIRWRLDRHVESRTITSRVLIAGGRSIRTQLNGTSHTAQRRRFGKGSGVRSRHQQHTEVNIRGLRGWGCYTKLNPEGTARSPRPKHTHLQPPSKDRPS